MAASIGIVKCSCKSIIIQLATKIIHIINSDTVGGIIIQHKNLLHKIAGKFGGELNLAVWWTA